MTLDVTLWSRLRTEKEARDAKRSAQESAVGGGSEPPHDDGMEQRVRALETNVASIDKTLSVMSEQLKHLASREDTHALQIELTTRTGKIETDIASRSGKLETDLASLSGKLDTKANATDLAELKGRVARIPTVPVLVSILLLISLLFAAASWTVRHLPEPWIRALQ